MYNVVVAQQHAYLGMPQQFFNVLPTSEIPDSLLLCARGRVSPFEVVSYLGSFAAPESRMSGYLGCLSSLLFSIGLPRERVLQEPMHALRP